MRAAVRSRVVLPTSAMKSGMRGRLTAMRAALTQSAPATTAMMVDRHDHGEEELRAGSAAK